MSTNSNPDRAEEIRIGISGACLMMPKDSAARAEEINRLHQLADEEKEAVAEAKDEVGLKEALKRANKVYGISKTTLKILKLLDGVKAAGDRAAVLTQVVILSKDKGDLDKDLVTLAEEAEAQAGQQADDQGSVFDKTSEGERRGGAQAQPRHVEQASPAPEAAPSPGIPLDDALRQLEAYNAANPPKRGAKPKERKRLEQQVEDAERARLQAEADAGPVAKADDFDGDDDLGPQHPAHAQMREQDEPAAPKPAAELDDDLPAPPKRKNKPLEGASGHGSYTLN